MRTVTPAVTHFVVDTAASGSGAMIRLRRRVPVPAASARSLAYASSPLLASKTPPWRSRFWW